MALTTVSVGLLVAAVGTIGYPFYTNLYQERLQDRLDRQIASPELKQAYVERNVGTGDALTHLTIPSIEVDVVVVEGPTASALPAGAGQSPDTHLPFHSAPVTIPRPPPHHRPPPHPPP